MSVNLDPRYTFDALVVGPANRLAVAAARRVADSPGDTYNPLFIYSGSGLGKTHLLGAIGHHAARVHGVPVVYETLERLLERVSAAVEAGERDAFVGRLREGGVLLLDDVQFLAGQRQSQEELLRAWDELASRGGQVVLTSDRPPQEIDGLDERLLSRLSGGLIVDMAAPDYETRVAIARRKAEERGGALDGDVYQALARIAFTNVRELQGALNRLLAVQELDHRQVRPEEVQSLLGVAAERGHDEFGEFLSEISGTVTAVVEEADQRMADAILVWEGEGYRTRRLESALSGTTTLAQAEEVIRQFEHDVERLRTIAYEIESLDPAARELDSDVFRDPDRVNEAETLLAAARERLKPPPAPPPGPSLDEIEGDSLAVRAARAVARDPGAGYNPLYVLGPAGSGKTTLLAALGRSLRDDPERVVGYIHAPAFADELIGTLERSRLDAWRARYRRADVLLVDDVEALEGSERTHEELFHLFVDLHGRGRQLVFSAAVPPHELSLPERLRSRLESGLVVELPAREPAPSVDEDPAPPAGEVVQGAEAGPATSADASPGNGARSGAGSGEPGLHSREKVLWEWPYPGDWLQEELD